MLLLAILRVWQSFIANGSQLKFVVFEPSKCEDVLATKTCKKNYCTGGKSMVFRCPIKLNVMI